MNFVIYSYNFFPQADAESFCATRFASALARAGHNVTVVTMDWPMQVSLGTYKALVAQELKIVRLPFSKKTNSPIKALLWYGHRSQMAVDVPQSILAVEKALQNYERPILITRTHPVVSTMVGLKSYALADKWIAHFSDPIPWFGDFSNSFGHKLLRFQEKQILRNAFKKADAISVTCMHVCRYFKQVYGDVFDEKKAFMTTHIGDYRLDSPPTAIDEINTEPILLHPGTIYASRGGNTIVDVMAELKNDGYNFKFVQVGVVDKSLENKLIDSSNVDIYNTISAEESISLRKKAKAIFVPDFESDLDYSPFILSKFVYQIMSNKPIVLYCKKDCEMRDYAIQYPESGIFWAEAGNVRSLKEAIIQVMSYDISTIDRTRIRNCFSEEVIVNSFVSSINS